MDEKKRSELDAELDALRSLNSAFLALVGVPPIPLVGGLPPVPIPVDATLTPYLAALRRHGEDFDRLLRIVKEILNDGA